MRHSSTRTADRVTTPFGAQSTAAEVLAGVDLSGRRAVVTGGASGIGIETARALAAAGAGVTIGVRDVQRGLQVAAEIKAATGRTVYVSELDLADLDSVAAFTDAWDGPLHILVNNAGVMASPLARTAQGWESQFATNHLGHFALTTGLHAALATDGARVVSVSSAAHLRGGVELDDPFFDRRAYEPWSAYAQSKSANVLFAVEGARRWADDQIVVNALHPGSIQTNLQRHVSEAELQSLREATGSAAPSWKSPAAGAATSVLLAGSPLVTGVTGRYFEDVNEAVDWVPGTRVGVAAHALDPETAARLWTLSEALVG